MVYISKKAYIHALVCGVRASGVPIELIHNRTFDHKEL